MSSFLALEIAARITFGGNCFGIEIEIPNAHRDEPHGVGIVVDREGRPIPQAWRLSPENPYARAVERRDPHPVRDPVRPGSATRSFISFAALFVKVMARIEYGDTPRSRIEVARCDRSGLESCPTPLRQQRARVRRSRRRRGAATDSDLRGEESRASGPGVYRCSVIELQRCSVRRDRVEVPSTDWRVRATEYDAIRSGLRTHVATPSVPSRGER